MRQGVPDSPIAGAIDAQAKPSLLTATAPVLLNLRKIPVATLPFDTPMKFAALPSFLLMAAGVLSATMLSAADRPLKLGFILIQRFLLQRLVRR